MVTIVTSNKIHSYFHIETDDKDKYYLCKKGFYAFTMNTIVVVEGPIPSSPPLVALPAWSSLLSIDDDPQPPDSPLSSSTRHLPIIMFRCHTTAIVGTHLWRSSANSPEP